MPLIPAMFVTIGLWLLGGKTGVGGGPKPDIWGSQILFHGFVCDLVVDFQVLSVLRGVE